MFHACTAKFDVLKNLEKFWNRGQQDLNLCTQPMMSGSQQSFCEVDVKSNGTVTFACVVVRRSTIHRQEGAWKVRHRL
jgi:hypothetical protein